MLMILCTIRFHPFLVNLKLTRIIESQVNTTSHLTLWKKLIGESLR